MASEIFPALIPALTTRSGIFTMPPTGKRTGPIHHRPSTLTASRTDDPPPSPNPAQPAHSTHPAWAPDSWKSCPITQGFDYPDPEALRLALDKLSRMPPLVTSGEIDALRDAVTEAQNGTAFLLQGGDCSESFAECTSEHLTRKLKILLKMSLVLTYGIRRRVIRIGRFAGQYTKPRSSLTETRGGKTLPSYRGPMVNGPAFTAKSRTPDPERLLKAYAYSAMTMNFLRSFIEGGFSDLHHPEIWQMEAFDLSESRDAFREIVDGMGRSIRFMEMILGHEVGELNKAEFFASHEAIHLDYEQARTRQVPRKEGWYNLATHFPWIGDRTRKIGGAHVEYMRGIANPIGVKIGPSMDPTELVELCEVLNPQGQTGRLVLIHRFGVGRIADLLPPLIRAVRQNHTVTRSGRGGVRKHRTIPVLWVCDPMHGNTRATQNGRKTRSFDDIRCELEQAFDLHVANGSRLGGLHFELTGENVTECVGGAANISENDLEERYETEVDPRLNDEQSLEMALLIARRLGTTENV
ncbi:MAG: 3-deoxy-7-phosphoheptulonate synthase class II [Planctomycetia bacterium]|nr:3-deoxy-7-phosphoheptulonate synthase class II [Planctomycetia bacterium]